MRREKNEKIRSAVRPNCGITASYRRKILALVDEMARSYVYWVKASYRAHPPRMAQDATPAAELQSALEKLGKRWAKRFDEAAPELAAYFAKSVSARSDRALAEILKKAGYSVKFRITPAMRDIMAATVQENVSLIKSIPQQYLTKVQGAVMRSVQEGRNLQSLTKELQEQFGVTRRRAEFIALDQNNKATSALMRARQTAMGLTEGVWMHSGAGKEPRPTHVANNGQKFNIQEGWFDPDPKVRKRIWPGQLIKCRCTWRVVVKGFS